MIKAAILATKDEFYQRCNPKGSSITVAKGEIADLKTAQSTRSWIPS